MTYDAFDVLNGIIYILRGKYVDGLISLASAALSVAADAILKPLRYAKNGVKEIFETIVKELLDLPSAASKILKGLANTVDGLWLVGRKIKDSIIKGINAVVEFIAKHTREAYQSIRSKLIKEVKETATEAATKGVKEATEDVIEDGVVSGVERTLREKLLDEVENPKLKNVINEIYRPGATIGDGGLADAVRYELSTRKLVGGKSHIKKAKERVINLERVINKEKLSDKDLEIANNLLTDLKDALGGK